MVISHKHKPPDKPPKPEPIPEPIPEPTPRPTPGLPPLISPPGKVSGAPGNNGVPWSQINQYDPSYQAWGEYFKIDPNVCKRMTVVESGGVNLSGGQPGSIGILQIKPAFWHDTADRLHVSLNTPDGQIAVCNAILSGLSGHGDYDSVEANFRTLYFTGDDAASGITQDAYWAWVAGGTTPAPQPKPRPQADPIRVIVGGDYPPVTYGFRADEGLAYYEFGVGHGTTKSTQHTGIDVGVPHLTKLYTPLPGRVLCRGERGQNVWGNGCGYYVDDMDGGDGNFTVLFDGGVRLTLGHCHRILVNPGDRVAGGQHVALSGGSHGDHVHIETAVERNGTYWLTDPVPTLKAAMTGTTPTDADTVDYDLWASNGNVYLVTPTKTTTTYLRADPTARTLGVIEKGTTVEAVALIVGQDGNDWFLLTDKRRVPAATMTFRRKVV